MFFFFSSRRRHTRWNCDWSSDVCSSDLGGDGERRATRPDRDGSEPAGARRLGGDAPDQGRAGDPAHTGDRAHFECHGRRPGEGPCSRLRRLRHQAAGAAASARQDPGAGAGGAQIVNPAAALLVVDDNEDNRYTLTRRLTREGYTNVTTANDGRQALELLQSRRFDLVLLDIMMPELNGYQVLEHLKASPELRHLPVIMISAIEEIGSVVRCIELGAEDYLPKPFDATLLRARVGASLEKKALRDEVQSQAAQLAEWNRKLEQRVQEQLAQLDRLGRLKSFFSPQLAESIINGGGEDLLKTHRREVVVAFLDMRGFTTFTDSSEPEEVMSVLAEYHGAMGPLILAHEGTLERFAGDGMMIFFNDPIALANPTANAVKMALAMQQRFVPQRALWKKRGYDLGRGIGIAQGYATLGAIGFEGRWDYACIGSVTNLAARLCSQAKGGQILTNQKTLSRIEDAVQAEPLGEVTLKGIAHPVPLFNITGVKV